MLDASGRAIETDSAAFLERVRPLTRDLSAPFDETATAVLGALSRQLLTSADARAEPQLTALGYWLRPAALARLAERSRSVVAGALRVARGMAYQLPPQNVDTLFVYSWALSFLVGNSNVTRLPSDGGPVVSGLIRRIVTELERGGQSHRQIFCSFDHRDRIGRELSALADLRVVWGGDAKVRAVGANPIRPDGISVSFPDRKSICLVGTDAYDRLDEAGRTALAERFYNDVFWFDQMGCGSPRVVVWLGENGAIERDLLRRVSDVALAKGRSTDVGVDLSKFVFANASLCSGTANAASRLSPALTRISADMASAILDEVHGGGLLFETHVPNIERLEPLIRRNLQTVATFGIEHDTKFALARLAGGRGGYRIVPIGEALQFDAIWDGIDLIQQFSRLVVVR